MAQKWRCIACGYIYDPAKGDPDGGIAPGTSFEDIPDDWVCPQCGVGKDMFEAMDQRFFFFNLVERVWSWFNDRISLLLIQQILLLFSLPLGDLLTLVLHKTRNVEPFPIEHSL